MQNQLKAWFPMNEITERLYYTNVKGDKNNQRVIVSALTPKPNVWQISKVESTSPFGLQKLTLYQDSFNPDTDYVNLETGEMYANYYSAIVTPEDGKEEIPDIPDRPDEITVRCEIDAASADIRVGGSYKLLTASFIDSNGANVTDKYKDLITPDSWTVYIDNELVDADLYTLKEQSDPNKIRIKFLGDTSYLAKILFVKCTIPFEKSTLVGTIQLEIVSI